MAQDAAKRAPLLPLLVFCVVPLLLHFFIVETGHIHGVARLFRLGFVTVSALSHWAIYAGLLLTFALTLRPGRTPLICAMAARMHGPLSTEVARYTRGVTIAWVVFFAAQLGLSIGLFCLAPLVAWSFFVNVLDIPLVVTMFAAEYAFRIRYLENPPRHTLAAILDMVAEIRKPGASTAMPL